MKEKHALGGKAPAHSADLPHRRWPACSFPTIPWKDTTLNRWRNALAPFRPTRYALACWDSDQTLNSAIKPDCLHDTTFC